VARSFSVSAGPRQESKGKAFRALFTLGRPDGAVGLDEMVAHAAALDQATALPLQLSRTRSEPSARRREQVVEGCLGSHRALVARELQTHRPMGRSPKHPSHVRRIAASEHSRLDAIRDGIGERWSGRRLSEYASGDGVNSGMGRLNITL
jgi:hypothetical protein